MADLNRDRGQLILIAALALAVIFVALAVISNSVIYTENLASRGETTSGGDALQLRNEVEQSVGEVVITTNEQNWSDRSSSLQDGIIDVEKTMWRQAATDARLVDLTYDSKTDGTRIYDNSSGGSTFEAAGGADDWDPVTGDTRVRRFQLQLDTDTITGSEDLGDGDWSDEFIINITNSGANELWQIHVGEDSSGDDTIRIVQGDKEPTSPYPSATVVGSCSIESSHVKVWVDITGATANGKHCQPLVEMWAALQPTPSADYDISYKDGDRIEGKYTMTVEDSTLSTAFNPTTPAPSYTPAVYETTVHLRYDGPAFRYESDIRVAPGEPYE